MDNHSSASEIASALYAGCFGDAPYNVEAMPGAGSSRRYFRLRHESLPSAVAAVGDDIAENRAFVALSEAFKSCGVRVPEVYAFSDDGRCCLQQDLGDKALLPLLAGGSRMELAEKSLRSLAHMQTVSPDVWKEAVCFNPFSKRLVMWDLNYFKYEFLKPSGVVFDEDRLEDDFESLSGLLTGGDRSLWGFMYRDFQSRNVMIRDGEPWMIDFQGGRFGPLAYDAVSFLWQAKAGFTDEERSALLSYYSEELASLRGIGKRAVEASVSDLLPLRMLQVLGAYGFRGLIERKSHFIESIPAAIANLWKVAQTGGLERYPEIYAIARRLAESRFAHSADGGKLTVKVFSFSYKKGYPEDLSGNGGGFMFDCRGMHNPGRYECYKPLTGLDAEVIEFLESKGEVQTFVERSLEMVSPTVARYLARGFSSLQVGFGCTGGRHRSVYCARKFAEEIASRFPDARVVLEHREQGIVNDIRPL